MGSYGVQQSPANNLTIIQLVSKLGFVVADFVGVPRCFTAQRATSWVPDVALPEHLEVNEPDHEQPTTNIN